MTNILSGKRKESHLRNKECDKSRLEAKMKRQ